jgi:hypothetical protein
VFGDNYEAVGKIVTKLDPSQESSVLKSKLTPQRGLTESGKSIKKTTRKIKKSTKKKRGTK